MDNIARGVRSRDQYSRGEAECFIVSRDLTSRPHLETSPALLCLETSPRVLYCSYSTNKPCFKCFIVICVGGVQLKKGIANK